MSFRLSRKERAGDGIRRMALEQIRGALKEANSKRLTPEQKVHQVRKHCKKLRALARLARPSLGEDYRFANDWFRDTARMLSGARDSQTVRKTLSLLSAQYRSRFSVDSCRQVQQQLQRSNCQVDEAKDVRRRLMGAAERMQEAVSRVERWALDVDGFPSVQSGLQRTYQSAGEAMVGARQSPSEAAFHEWRKHVKYHWYHCRILCGIWPEVLHARRGEVHRLAEALGNDHDLAVLQNAVTEQPAAFGKPGQRRRLLKLIDRHRAEIESESVRLGQLLFAETPDAFVDRYQAYWNAWKGSVAH